MLNHEQRAERENKIVRQATAVGFVFVALALCLLIGVVQAEAKPVLSHDRTVQMLHSSHVAVHRCQRRSPVYFHCWVSYWLVLEQEHFNSETESWELVAVYRHNVFTTADVGLRGVHLN